jgi:hypothetical protein
MNLVRKFPEMHILDIEDALLDIQQKKRDDQSAIMQALKMTLL